MSELAIRAAVDLTAWTADAQSIYGVAKVLAETPFAGPMQGDPASVMAAIMLGADHGMHPMAALRNIHVIEKQPTMSALALRGLVQGQGHKIELVEASDTRVVMRGRRKDSDKWQEVTWTLDRARKANLAQKKNWQQNPQAMLVARASSELCRLVAADVLLGCPYSSEELSDGAGPGLPAPEPEPVKKATTRTAQRQPMPEPDVQWGAHNTVNAAAGHTRVELHDRVAIPADEPQLEIAATPEPAPDDKITDTTRKAIMAGFNEIGIKDRTPRLERVSKIVGREVPSVNVLTEAEARTVVEALNGARRDRPADRDTSYDWPEMSA